MESVKPERETVLSDELGRLVRLVGHDVRNHLSVMGNSVYYLTMKLGREDPKIARHLGILSQEVAETSRLVTNLVDFLAPKVPQPTPLYLNDLVKQMAERTIRHPKGPHLQVVAPEEIRVLGDEAQVMRALENIFLHRWENLGPDDTLMVLMRSSEGKGWVEFTDGAPEAGAAITDGRIVPEGPIAAHLGLWVARRLLALNGGGLQQMRLAGEKTCLRAWLPLT